MSVTVTHPEYDSRVKEWCRIRTVLAGRDAIIDAGEEFVPILGGQSAASYQAYLMRGLWFGATQRTRKGIVGLVFSQKPQFTTPSNIEKIMEDVTLTDVSLEEFAREVFSEAIAYNWGGILVDIPADDGEEPLTPEERRPYLTFYHAFNVRWWKMERIKGKLVPTVIILQEQQEKPIAGQEYGSEYATTYRVLKLERSLDSFGRPLRIYVQEEWEEVDKEPTGPMGPTKEWRLTNRITPLRRGKTFDFIPFTFTTTEGIEPHICKSELLDLVDINLDHWRQSVDLRHGLHFTALPTPCASAVPDGMTLKIGSEEAWTSQDPNFKSWYLEFSGAAMQALTDVIERDEQLMALLGSRLLETQKRASETAEAMVIRQAGEDSVVMSSARSVEKALEKSLWYMSWWLGNDNIKPGEVVISLTQALSDLMITTPDMIVIMKAYQSGLISEQAFLEAFIRKQYIRGVTWEEESAREKIDPKMQLITGTELQSNVQNKAMMDRNTVTTGGGVTNDKSMQPTTN